MITVVCVLRSGGDFHSGHVRDLERGVAKHAGGPFRFVCLTDLMESVSSAGIPVLPLSHGWPGWWAKCEAFGVPAPCLYLDLSTIVVGSLASLFHVAQTVDGLAMLNGFYRPEKCSGVMAWSTDMSWITDACSRVLDGAAFERHRLGYTAVAGGHRYRGDQMLIREVAEERGTTIRVLDGLAAGIASYKVHVSSKAAVPDGASLVCFHGRPRPHEVHPKPAWMVA